MHADSRQVHDDIDAEAGQEGGVADTRELEEL